MVSLSHDDAQGKTRSVCVVDDDDDDEHYLPPLHHDSKGNENITEKKKDVKVLNEEGIMSCQRLSISKHRKRRRSSARFLRMSGRFDGDFNAYNNENEVQSQEYLSEMYHHAIRLNAENKINAGNSWKLQLIDNIDKFLVDDEEGNDGTEIKVKDTLTSKLVRRNKENNKSDEKRVNFTKASCTLDASVKIYSYRVDDVHLSSYKVLANLNRTDGGAKKIYSEKENDINKEKHKEIQKNVTTREHIKVETLESNPTYLNMAKHDKAYDIDPIFHKMSQKFDEGGAKGLLLVNLGIATDSCRIVLDSKNESGNDNESDFLTSDEKKYQNKTDEKLLFREKEGPIDISKLANLLQESFTTTSIESCHLVPQLDSLRLQYECLHDQGFVIGNETQLKSNLYANDEDDEKAAEEDILEQSRLSLSRLSLNNTVSNTIYPGDNTFADNDFLIGVDHEEEDEFNDVMDENIDNFASLSFHENEFNNTRRRTVNFLEVLCTDHILKKDNDYEYFDMVALENISEGNIWAGSSHWKKNKSKRMNSNILKIKNKNSFILKNDIKGKKNKKKMSNFSYVDLIPCHHESVNTLLTVKLTKAEDKVNINKSIVSKPRKNNNILPPDVGIGIEHLLGLFLLPGEVFSLINDKHDSKISSRKSVSFFGVDDTFDENYDESFCVSGDIDTILNYSNDEIDGNIVADASDYVIEDLEGVRKVKKTRVSHATVAKKVDVKKLKKDLWEEVKAKTEPLPYIMNSETDYILENDNNFPNQTACSFKETVETLAESQKQDNVSLAFYFICILHLANEKVLRLDNDNCSLKDFFISRD